MRAALVAMVLLAACRTPRDALVHGKHVARPSFGYSDGEMFSVEHRRAYPDVFAGDRPYFIDDGELGGRACGLELQFVSEWYGNRMTLYGRGRTPQAMSDGFGMTVTIDELGPGHLRIRGSTAGIAPFPIDIDVSSDRLAAQVDTRHVDLHAEGHWLVGRVVQHGDGFSIEAPFVVYGREMLRTMVPADEALILLMMITCNATIDYGGHQLRGFSLVSSPLATGAAIDTRTDVVGGTADHGPPAMPSMSPMPDVTGGGIDVPGHGPR